MRHDARASGLPRGPTCPNWYTAVQTSRLALVNGESPRAQLTPSSVMRRAMVALATHEHWHPAKGHNLVGLAADEELRQPTATVRRHHDEVAHLRLGGFDDALGGMLVLHMDSGAGDIQLLR